MVKIFTCSNIGGTRERNGKISYMLKMERARGDPAELYKIEDITKATRNRASLVALIKALEHMTKPSEISIYPDTPYLQATLAALSNYKSNDFCKKDGTPLTHMNELIRLDELLSPHTIIEPETTNEYLSWMRTELARYPTAKITPEDLFD